MKTKIALVAMAVVLPALGEYMDSGPKAAGMWLAICGLVAALRVLQMGPKE